MTTVLIIVDVFSTLKRALMTSQRALFLVDVEREVDLDHLGGLVHATAAQARQEDAGLGHVRVAVRLRLCAVLPVTHKHGNVTTVSQNRPS